MSTLSIEHIQKPELLGDTALEQLQLVSQELWSARSSLGELALCQSCQKTIAKEDLFGAGEAVRYTRVNDLLKDTDTVCPHCGEKSIQILYGKPYIQKLREKYATSIHTYLVLARDEGGALVGYEEAYIAPLQAIYQQELIHHYKKIGLPHIKRQIARLCPALSLEDPFLVLGSIGLIARYQSLENIYQVLQAFQKILPQDPQQTITEIDRRNALHKISMKTGGVSLAMDSDTELGPLIGPKSPEYQSDLIVFEDIRRVFSHFIPPYNRRFFVPYMRHTSL